jgi:hypothetical protein
MGNQMSLFDEDLFLKGLEQRKDTPGAEYVEKTLLQPMISHVPFKRR